MRAIPRLLVVVCALLLPSVAPAQSSAWQSLRSARDQPHTELLQRLARVQRMGNDSALSAVRALAAAGHADYQYLLGLAHVGEAVGFGAPIMPESATVQLRRAAAQGHPQAHLVLADWSLNARWTHRLDLAAHRRHLHAAAVAGDSMARVILDHYANPGSDRDAIAFRDAVIREDATALVTALRALAERSRGHALMLGSILLNGSEDRSVRLDSAAGWTFMRKAASHGDRLANFWVGLAMLQGTATPYVPADTVYATRVLLPRAARENHPLAKLLLHNYRLSDAERRACAIRATERRGFMPDTAKVIFTDTRAEGEVRYIMINDPLERVVQGGRVLRAIAIRGYDPTRALVGLQYPYEVRAAGGHRDEIGPIVAEILKECPMTAGPLRELDW